MERAQRVVLIVLDGFGIPDPHHAGDSPFLSARKPVIHGLEQFYPMTTLQASGIAVGLPVGHAGNSEVGHLTIGAGRTLYHHLARIITAIEDGSFFTNPAFVSAVDHVRASGGTLHLFGLFSTGSVHAYTEHVYALCDMVSRAEIPAAIHIVSDGKDAGTRECVTMINELERYLARPEYARIHIASVMGRFYAMDRDGHWDRTEAAYRCLTGERGGAFTSARTYVEASYEADVEDERITPAWKTDASGAPLMRLKAGDAVIMWNFREDSERQIARAFSGEPFSGFARERIPDLSLVTMTEYEKGFPAVVAFPPLDVIHPIAEVLASSGRRQMHIAETEKYAHVTYFFNGGNENPFTGEDRVLIASPATAHIDEFPAMAASEVTARVTEAMTQYDFIVANYANTDMVGHTGNFEATVQAVEAVDRALGDILACARKCGAAVVITGDHGNAEEKYYRLTGYRRTKHTTNVVPLYLVDERFRLKEPRTSGDIEALYRAVKGTLADVAPTILELYGIAKPEEMTGVSLLKRLLN